MKDDIISRQAAIDAIMKMPTVKNENGEKFVHQELTKIRIEILPPIQSEPQWIPCSEQLPKEYDAGILKKFGINKRSDYVLATIEAKGKRMRATICTHDGVWYWSKKYAFPDYKVVAWMPFPALYQEGSGQNDT